MARPAVACSTVKGPVLVVCGAAAILFPSNAIAMIAPMQAANRLNVGPIFVILSLQDFWCSFCSAHLQVGTCQRRRCPPEGRRYTNHGKSQPHRFPSGARSD